VTTVFYVKRRLLTEPASNRKYFMAAERSKMEAKMDCARASDMLSLYIDDMLGETEAQDLRLHLDECALCAEEYRQLRLMKAALLGIPDVPLPARFDGLLRQALTRPPLRRRRRMLVSAAAVFAVGLLSLFVYWGFDAGDAAVSQFSGNASAEIAEKTPGDGGRSSVGVGASVFEPEDARPLPDVSAIINAGAASGDAGRGEGYAPPGYPARGTSVGAHRLNEKAIYDEMLEEKLEGWKYEILWEEKRGDDYVYRVNMISNGEGAEFNQEIEAVASENTLQILYATEFMGLN
jgi:anti-sigma factor RsiW